MKTSTIPTLLGPDGMTSLREYAGYHGGGSGFGGQLRAWNPPGESVDAALLPNFTRGNARADDLVRNNGYAANAIQLHQDHIVGSFFRLSHRPSWRYLGIGEEEARAFSREVETAWKEFAEDDCCCIDVERKRTFTMMIREGVAMHAFNGELFVQATWDTSSSRLFRTQFRMVSPKRISNPNNTKNIIVVPLERIWFFLEFQKYDIKHSVNCFYAEFKRLCNRRTLHRIGTLSVNAVK